MKPFVTQVWPQFTADAQFNACFGQVLVERVELYRTARRVVIACAAPSRWTARCAGALPRRWSRVRGYELTLKNYFNYGAITPDAARQLIEELKAEGLPVNGFLDKSPIANRERRDHCPRGRRHEHPAESIDFPRRLAERIQERTGTLPIVRMAATGKTMAPEGV